MVSSLFSGVGWRQDHSIFCLVEKGRDGSILCLVERINRNRMDEKFDAVSYCCSGTHQDPCVNLVPFYYIYVNLFSPFILYYT